MRVPFRCNHCHKYGHVIARCDLNFNRKLWDKKHVKQWQVKADKVVPCADVACFNNCMDYGILEDKVCCNDGLVLCSPVGDVLGISRITLSSPFAVLSPNPFVVGSGFLTLLVC